MFDEADAEEWAYGHDCEAPQHPAPVSTVSRGTLSGILRESAERTGQGPIVAQHVTRTIDIGDRCTHCGCDTSPGSGAWINRIPSSAQHDAESPELVGYMCADCQCITCDRCGAETLDYSAAPNGDGFWCDDCHDAAQDSRD